MASGLCLADIGKHRESSPEVQVYRALEKEFLEGEQGKEHFAQLGTTLCGWKPGVDAQIDTFDSAGKTIRVTGKAVATAPCVQLLETRWVCGLPQGQQYFRAPTWPTLWGPAMHGVAFAVYVRALARRASIPEEKIGQQLAAIDETTLENIRSTLAPSKPGETKLPLALSDRWRENETALKRRWNQYVKALPASDQQRIPLLLSLLEPPLGHTRMGCLLATKAYLVRTKPPGGVVRLIGDFDWRICDATKRDAWSNACPGWTVVAADRQPLWGTYRYEAKWPTGKVSRELLNVDAHTGEVLDLP